MIAPCAGDGKAYVGAKNAEKTGESARRWITNSLKEP
jgi:hypothetical protein